MTIGPEPTYDEAKHRRLVKSLYVYKERDLTQIIEDMAWLGQYWRDFIAYHGTKSGSEERAELYRRLCGQSHVARELEKLRKKRNNPSTPPQSPQPGPGGF
jgi:hypothetical protein